MPKRLVTHTSEVPLLNGTRLRRTLEPPMMNLVCYISFPPGGHCLIHNKMLRNEGLFVPIRGWNGGGHIVLIK